MTAGPVDVGTEVAQLHFYLATAARCDHELGITLGAIDQCSDARIGSAVDDAWVWALNVQRNEQIAALAAGLNAECPDCQAAAGEECHIDCSSRWDNP